MARTTAGIVFDVATRGCFDFLQRAGVFDLLTRTTNALSAVDLALAQRRIERERVERQLARGLDMNIHADDVLGVPFQRTLVVGRGIGDLPLMKPSSIDCTMPPRSSTCLINASASSSSRVVNDST